MSRITPFIINPLEIPELAMLVSRTRELARTYAAMFDAENGESVSEYATRIAYEVFPGRFHAMMHRERAEFRTMLRAELKNTKKNEAPV